MHRALLLSACLALALSACGSDPMDESIDVANEMADILSGVKDEASAKAAKPKLQALAKRMEELSKRMAEDKASPEEQMKRMEAYGEKMAEAWGRLMQELMRVGSDPKLSVILDDIGETSSPLGG